MIYSFYKAPSIIIPLCYFSLVGTTAACSPVIPSSPATTALATNTDMITPMFLADKETPTGEIHPTSSHIATIATPSFTPTASVTDSLFHTNPIEDDSPHLFPIQPVEVVSYAPGHHGYPAVDIFAPEGTAFVAVTHGVVDFISYEDLWDPTEYDPATRGGLAIAIIGDDGVRYYGSHLSEIEPDLTVGMLIHAGQTLGKVGNTGNARYVAPHLHFGISRPTYPEDWIYRRGEVDPYPYLTDWEQGVNTTPILAISETE